MVNPAGGERQDGYDGSWNTRPEATYNWEQLKDFRDKVMRAIYESPALREKHFKQSEAELRSYEPYPPQQLDRYSELWREVVGRSKQGREATFQVNQKIEQQIAKLIGDVEKNGSSKLSDTEPLIAEAILLSLKPNLNQLLDGRTRSLIESHVFAPNEVSSGIDVIDLEDGQMGELKMTLIRAIRVKKVVSGGIKRKTDYLVEDELYLVDSRKLDDLPFTDEGDGFRRYHNDGKKAFSIQLLDNQGK